MYPILPARGNHDSDSVIHNIFDTSHAKNYYAFSFGGNLLRAYTLNSEITEGGIQGDWLKNDLESKGQEVTFRMAQYHKPMRPHNSGKSEGNNEYNAWAHTFYDNNVDLVVESDSHMVKRTYPIRPSSGSNSDEGFQRDDAKGTYYIGEGCWGAPLRAANDDKEWTMASGSFNQCNWIQVHPDRMEVRTIKVNNASDVDSVTENNPFTPPKNIDIWNDTLIIGARNEMLAEVILTEPEDNAMYNPDSVINMAADTFSDIEVVRFWVTEESGDAYVIETDNTPPFEYNTDELTPGKYKIHARGKDSNGKAYDSQVSTITIRESNTYVSLTAPQYNSTFNSGNDLKMAADTSSDIIIVRFWVTPETGDSYVIEVDKQAPFEFKTNSLLPGKYEIRAIGKDADGITYATQEAAIEILPPSNKVTLVSPSNGSIYESDESITMAADTSSDIEVVRFWVTPENETPYVIHTDNEQPFEYIANNLPTGKYSFHARGIDSNGNSHDSKTVEITVNKSITNEDISKWKNYSTTEIKINRIREWQSIDYNNSKKGTTELLLLSTSHGDPPHDQMRYKHEVRGGSWRKISYAGNDDKSLEVWMRHVNNSNVNDMGELDVKGGNGKLTLLTYNNILNTGNIVNKNQLSASTIKITNSGSAPFLVVAASDNGGNSNIANAEQFKGDDIIFIYLTESASFKDLSVSKFRGAISSIQLK